MKRSIKTYLIIASIWAMTAGCTQNNGDISPWFGYWRMTSLTIDGESDPEYTDMITWSFQNNIVFINTNLPNHEYDEGVGTWSADETTLTLDYTHSHGQGNYEYLYTPPAVLRIPNDRPVDFTIESLSGRNTTLSRTLDDGSVMQCKLEKAY